MVTGVEPLAVLPLPGVVPSSEGAGTRTQDLRIKSPLLYRLSYASETLQSIALTSILILLATILYNRSYNR